LSLIEVALYAYYKRRIVYICVRVLNEQTLGKPPPLFAAIAIRETCITDQQTGLQNVSSKSNAAFKAQTTPTRRVLHEANIASISFSTDSTFLKLELANTGTQGRLTNDHHATVILLELVCLSVHERNLVITTPGDCSVIDKSSFSVKISQILLIHRVSPS
jgi:hypothetical protein